MYYVSKAWNGGNPVQSGGDYDALRFKANQKIKSHFLPREATRSAVLPRHVVYPYPSVRLSVCL